MVYSFITVRHNTGNLDPERASFEEKWKSRCLDTTNTSTAN